MFRPEFLALLFTFSVTSCESFNNDSTPLFNDTFQPFENTSNDTDFRISNKTKDCSKYLVSEIDIHRYVLSKNYSRTARPIRNGTMPLPVKLGFVLDRIEDIIEKFRTITLSGYLTVHWRDEFLVWDDVEPLNCIEKVVFSADQVWFPDVVIINSGDKYSIPLARGHKIEVRSDGQSSYFPSGTFTTSCDLDLRYFPFDKQKCVLRVGSWCYWKEMQPIELIDPPIDFGNLSINEQWTLVKADGLTFDIQYPLDPRNWQKIEWALHLQRKSAYYIINVIVPSCIISVVEVVTFALPLHKVMKVHISFTALLAYSVFQLMIIGDIPRASEHTPLLTIYIDLSMAYIGVVLLGEGVVFVCLDRSKHRKISPPKLLFKILLAIGFLFGYDKEEIYRDEPGSGDDEPKLSKSKSGSDMEPAFFNLTGRYFDATAQNEIDVSRRHHHGHHHSNKVSNNSSVVAYWSAKAFAPDYYGYNIDTNGQQNNGSARIAAEAFERTRFEKAKAVAAEMVNQRSWELMAKTFEKCILLFYVLAIIFTPITIFLILPAARPIDM